MTSSDSNSVEGRRNLLQLCKAVQRAAREMTGYFGGYTFKGQPVGKGAVKLLDKSLEYVRTRLEEAEESTRLRKTALRTMVDFHHSTTTRPSTEEMNLSLHVCKDDVRKAEFIRTYLSVEFCGVILLK